jgi:hypothetical protein
MQGNEERLANRPGLRLLIPPFLAICAVLALVIYEWGPETVTRDFTGFYAAAKMAVECPHLLYDAQTQLKYQTALGLGPDYLPFPYPAIVPLMFVPFTCFSLSTAYWLALAVNVSLLFLCLLLMIREYELKREEAKLLLLVASTAFPIFTTLVAGQFAFFILLLIVMFFAGLKKNRVTAGIWAGALVVKPSLLVIPLLTLLLRRNTRALLAAGATAAGIIVLSGLVVGWQGLSDQAALLIAMGRDPAALANLQFMHNLRALAHWLGLGDVGALILSGLVILSLFTVPRPARSAPAFMIASLTATALVSPHLHTYDLPILLPLVAFGVPTGIWWQRACFLGPLAILLLTYQLGAVPIIPVVLLTLFVLSVLKARKGRVPPRPVSWDRLPEHETTQPIHP